MHASTLMGPTTLFDKSFLQSLSVDESVWFDQSTPKPLLQYAAVAPFWGKG